jgi:hypothetical protein
MSFSYSTANFGKLEPGSWPHWPLDYIEVSLWRILPMLRGYIVTDVLHSFLPGPSHLAPKYRQPGMIRYDWEKQGISEVFCWRLIEFATSQWSMQKSDVFLSHVFDCLCFLLSSEHPRRHVQVWPSISCCPYVTMLPSLFSIFLFFSCVLSL